MFGPQKQHWIILLDYKDCSALNFADGILDFVLVSRYPGKVSSKMGVLNVLLIEWKGNYAERVAVGRFFEDAWIKRGPVMKDIELV